MFLVIIWENKSCVYDIFQILKSDYRIKIPFDCSLKRSLHFSFFLDRLKESLNTEITHANDF